MDETTALQITPNDTSVRSVSPPACAVNCASFSCPNLPLRAFRGVTLGPALDATARAYVNSPRAVTFDGDLLVVSSIYKWYAKDFGGSDARVIAHLARYANEPLKARLKTATRIGRDTYDLSLIHI